MALGNKKADSSAAGMGMPPPMPPGVGGAPVAPPQADELINSLDERLQQLQSTVAALVERTTNAATVPGESSPDAEVVAASRTLQMAKQTADATIAEAKEEAAKLVADARLEHDSLLREAREAADKEFGNQRDALAAEVSAWEVRKRDLTAAFEGLDERLSDYGDRLAEAHKIVKDALAEPVLVPEPEPEPEPEPVIDLSEAGESATVLGDDGVAPGIGDAETVPAESGETMFGTPPAPVFASATDGGSQAFYPWSGNSIPGQAPASSEVGGEESQPEQPAPPVQRRGLFGH